MRNSTLAILTFAICAQINVARADFFWQPSESAEEIEQWRSASSQVLSGISFSYSILADIEARNELDEAVDAGIQRFQSASRQFSELSGSQISNVEIDLENIFASNEQDGLFVVQTFESSGLPIPETVGEVLELAVVQTDQAAEFLLGVRDKISFTQEDQLLFDELMGLNSHLVRLGRASGILLRSVAN
jgi:hypothetical protein